MTARTQDRIPKGYVRAKTSAEQAQEYSRLADAATEEFYRRPSPFWKVFRNAVHRAIVAFYAKDQS